MNIQTEDFLNNPNQKTVIIICGPTGVGKTSVAIQLAKHRNTEIISADSRQCFKELNIGVARPLAEELAEVKHHFIASHSINEEMNAVVFERFALQKTNELLRLHDVIVMVGGTGLYLKAFSEGLDIIPDIEPAIRENIIRNYEVKGLEWLQQELKLKDPSFYETGEIQNPQRMMRALEVVEATGQSIVSFRKGAKNEKDFTIIKTGLELPREELIRNINTRTDKMMEAGLLEEVKELTPFKKLNALQTVGYKELFDYLDGDISLNEAVSRIKINTRQYAKRQMTWFKKDKSINWFHPDDIQALIAWVKQ